MKVEYGWLDFYAAATATLAILFTFIKLVRDLRNSKERVKIILEYHIFGPGLVQFEDETQHCYEVPGFIVHVINKGKEPINILEMNSHNGFCTFQQEWWRDRETLFSDKYKKDSPIELSNNDSVFSKFSLAFPEFYQKEIVKVRYTVTTRTNKTVSRTKRVRIQPEHYKECLMENCLEED